jgi:DNA-binding transcriptional LysR family regulator
MDPLTDLRLVATFVAVAEERHFRRAAERLDLAQPVVSRQIQRLERTLGVTLLERTSRNVALTEAGLVFLDAARRLLHDTERAVGQARRTAEGRVGRLTVGFVESAAFELLAPLLRRLEEVAPDLTVELRELSTEQQLGELRTDVDVAIARDLQVHELAEQGLAARHLLRERLHVALPSDHPLAGRSTVSLRLLADESFILFPRPRVPRSYDHVIAVCERSGFQPRIATHALQYTTMMALVAARRGAALAPGAVRAVRPAGVALVPLLDQHAITHLTLAWRGPLGSVLSTFVEVALEVAEETAAASPGDLTGPAAAEPTAVGR